jgi:hypothetical protein
MTDRLAPDTYAPEAARKYMDRAQRPQRRRVAAPPGNGMSRRTSMGRAAARCHSISVAYFLPSPDYPYRPLCSLFTGRNRPKTHWSPKTATPLVVRTCCCAEAGAEGTWTAKGPQNGKKWLRKANPSLSHRLPAIPCKPRNVLDQPHTLSVRWVQVGVQSRDILAVPLAPVSWSARAVRWRTTRPADSSTSPTRAMRQSSVPSAETLRPEQVALISDASDHEINRMNARA